MKKIFRFGLGNIFYGREGDFSRSRCDGSNKRTVVPRHVKFGMEKENVQSCLFKYEYGDDAKI